MNRHAVLLVVCVTAAAGGWVIWKIARRPPVARPSHQPAQAVVSAREVPAITPARRVTLTVEGAPAWEIRLDDGGWRRLPCTIQAPEGQQSFELHGPSGATLAWRLQLDRERTITLTQGDRLGRGVDLILGGKVHYTGPGLLPERLVSFVDSYLLGRDEVTNGQYLAFLSRFSARQRVRLLPRSEDWRSGRPLPGRQDWPVWGVLPEAALRYAVTHDGRLPTQSEWVRAACSEGSLGQVTGPYGTRGLTGGVREYVVAPLPTLFGGPGMFLVAGGAGNANWVGLRRVEEVKARRRGGIRLARSLLGSLDPERARQSADAGVRLEGYRLAQTTGTVIRGLADPCRQVRAVCRIRLAELGGRQLPRTVDGLLRAPEPLVRLEAVRLACWLEDGRLLLAGLADKALMVRRQAALGLLRLPSLPTPAMQKQSDMLVRLVANVARIYRGDRAVAQSVVRQLVKLDRAAVTWCVVLATLLPDACREVGRLLRQRSEVPGTAAAFAQLATALDRWGMGQWKLLTQRQSSWLRVLGPLQLASELAPENPVVAFRLGFLYLSAQRYQRSVEASSRAIELAPKMLMAYNNRSAAHFWSANWSAAESDAGSAARLPGGAGLPNPHFFRGAAAAMQGQVRVPIQSFQRIHRIPARVASRQIGGAEYLERRTGLLLSRYPGRPEARSVRALHALLGGRTGPAKALLERARGPLALTLRAVLALKAGERARYEKLAPRVAEYRELIEQLASTPTD